MGTSGYDYETVCMEHVKETGVSDSVPGVTPETLRDEGSAGARDSVLGSKRPRAVVSPGDSVPRWLRITSTDYNAPQGAIRYRYVRDKG